MQPKTLPDIISGRLYQLGRADLHNYLQPWSTMPSFDREVAALPRDTGKGGRERTQLGWPEPQFALILLHILLHPFSCNSVIALSKSFLIDVSYCSLERRREGTTVHSLRPGSTQSSSRLPSQSFPLHSSPCGRSHDSLAFSWPRLPLLLCRA